MFSFCADDLFTEESGVLKSPTIVGLVLICVYNYKSGLFMKSVEPE